MADLASRLVLLRQERQVTQQELARVLHVEQSAVSHWETGKKLPAPQTETRIADYFEVSVDYLRGRSNIPNPEALGLIPMSKTRLVPILKTLSIPLNRADENVEGWREVPEEEMEGGSDYFYWRVKDDAMAPQVKTDYLVLVQEESRVEDGQGAAAITGGKELIRRLFTNEGTIFLKADNPEFPPIIAKNNEVQIVGRIVNILSEFK